MRIADLVKLNAARAGRRATATLTDLSSAEMTVFVEGDVLPSDMEGAIASALNSGKATHIDVNGRSHFINPYLPQPRIIAIGAVHISQALARLAPVAGYDLTIIDPRTAFATDERFHGSRLISEWPEDVLKERPLDAYTAVAALTHDPKIDDFPLSAALTAGCFYVGALGSHKTHAKRVERLLALGHEESAISRIAAPIGLDIGAASPGEIALATLAQIVGAFRRRTPAPGE